MTTKIYGDYYFKKAIPVLAFKWSRDSYHPVVQAEIDEDLNTARSFIPTIENQRLYLTEGCYIVGPGAKGEYWPVDAEVFEATYEKIES